MRICCLACAMALVLVSSEARARCSLIDFIEKPHVSERVVRAWARAVVLDSYELSRKLPGPHYVLKPEVVDRLMRAEIANVESTGVYCVTFP